MSIFKKAEKKVAAKDSANTAKTRVPESLKDATDKFQETEIELPRQIRDIEFHNPISLVNGCKKEIQKIDIEIGVKGKELIQLQKEEQDHRIHLTTATTVYKQACKANECLDAQLINTDLMIALKELEEKGARSAADELKRVQTIAKQKFSQFVRNQADLTSGTNESIANLQILRDKRVDDISKLKAKKKELENKASAEQEKESRLSEQVIFLQRKLDFTVNQIAELNSAVTSLHARKKERQEDIEIILKKSGFGEIMTRLTTLEAQLKEANVITEDAHASISKKDGTKEHASEPMPETSKASVSDSKQPPNAAA